MTLKQLILRSAGILAIAAILAVEGGGLRPLEAQLNPPVIADPTGIAHFVAGQPLVGGCGPPFAPAGQCAAGVGVGVNSSGAAGGDLGGAYPNPTVLNGAHLTAGSVPNAALVTAPLTAASTLNGANLTAGSVPNTALTTNPLNAGNINAGILGAAFGGTGVNNSLATLTLNQSVIFAGATGGFTFTVGGGGADNVTIPGGNPTLLSTQGATQIGALAGNPAGTTSLTGVMMGLGSTCKLTPVWSTRLLLEMHGTIQNGTASDGASASIKFNTGSAPTNGTAVTGTTTGGGIFLVNNASAAVLATPFAVIGLATGLTPGTAIWYDLDVLALTAGTATVSNVSCTASEI